MIEGGGDPLDGFPAETPEKRPYPSGLPLQLDPEQAYLAGMAANRPSVIAARAAAVLLLVGVFAAGIGVGTRAWRRPPSVAPLPFTQSVENVTVPPVPVVRSPQPDASPAPVPAPVAQTTVAPTRPEAPTKAREIERLATAKAANPPAIVTARAANPPATVSRRNDLPLSRDIVEFAALVAPTAPPLQEEPRQPEPVAASPVQPLSPIVQATSVAAATSSQSEGAPLLPPRAAPAVTLPRVDEDGAVRATLGLYREAYERLDATAAKRVWPAVDERALSKAFANLESQSLTFRDCKTTVSGAAASASCRGTTTFVGRLGSRNRQTESREWTFKLQKAGNAWEVRSVQVR